MSYNKKNKLMQMQKVVEIYEMYKPTGVSTVYIYRTYIYPVYPISLGTLYNYLSTPIKKELKELGGGSDRFDSSR